MVALHCRRLRFYEWVGEVAAINVVKLFLFRGTDHSRMLRVRGC